MSDAEMLDEVSYLNGESWVWYLEDELDPPASLKEILEHVAIESADGIEMVMRGYDGLKKRYPDATSRQCLWTSLLWWTG